MRSHHLVAASMVYAAGVDSVTLLSISHVACFTHTRVLQCRQAHTHTQTNAQGEHRRRRWTQGKQRTDLTIGQRIIDHCDWLTWPGPTWLQSALALQPPRVSSWQLLISTHTWPSPVHPSAQKHEALPGPTKTHSACEGSKKRRRPGEGGGTVKKGVF